MNPPTRSLVRLLMLIGTGIPLVEVIRAADPVPGEEPTAQTATTPQLTQAELDELLGPIALYPDALVALILPAATDPAEVVLAARFLDAKGDPAQIDAQPWGDSVKALARYPEVIQWMNTNLQWTKQVGDAFLDQPTDLMNSVQRLRAKARSTGALVTTPQQQVVDDDGSIEILPAQPDVIYVPRYDPQIVYVTPAPDYFSPSPYVTFGAGFPVGLWLSYDFDWRRRTIWVGNHQRDWREHHEWRLRHPDRGPNAPRNPNWHAWHPPSNRPRPPRDSHRPRPEVVRPRPFPGAPNSPPRTHGNDANRPPRPSGNVRPTRAVPSPGAPGGNLAPRTLPAPAVPPPGAQGVAPANRPRMPHNGQGRSGRAPGAIPQPFTPRATPVAPPRATAIAPPRATPIAPPQATPQALPRATPQVMPQAAPPAQRLAPPPPAKSREPQAKERQN